jgi:hypothetical protein
MLRLEDENQINDDVQPSGDDTQQAPQADEETADKEESVEEGAAEEKTEEGNVEGGAE